MAWLVIDNVLDGGVGLLLEHIVSWELALAVVGTSGSFNAFWERLGKGIVSWPCFWTLLSANF